MREKEKQPKQASGTAVQMLSGLIIGGLCGFLMSLISGEILAAIQANGNMLFGIPVYGQQVLAVISTAGIVTCILILHFVVEKQEVLVQ